MSVNTEAFYDIAAIVSRHPEMHDQFDYIKGMRPFTRDKFEPQSINMGAKLVSCGASQCIAGWALVWEYGKISIGRENIDQTRNVHLPDGTELRAREVGGHAADILGMDKHDANTLFHRVRQEAVDWPALLQSLGDGMDLWDALEQHWIDDDEGFHEEDFEFDIY